MTEENNNIKLEDFIAQSLIQIINGVKTAQGHAKENGAEINSGYMIINQTNGLLHRKSSLSSSSEVIQSIEFDIAVTASTEGNIKGGAGIFVSAAGIGYNAQKTTGNTALSRIKFSVPIVLPTQK